MNPTIDLIGALALAGCVGVSVYLFFRGRIPARSNRSPTPWVLLLGRLTFLTVAGFALLSIKSVLVFGVSFVAFLSSVMIEVHRRQRADLGKKQE